jgi:hypothetical protein
MSLNLFRSSLGRVKSIVNRVPSGKDVSVGMNVPEYDISLVVRSKTIILLPAFMALSLT